MNILILGITGLIGSNFFLYLSQKKKINVYGTLRKNSKDKIFFDNYNTNNQIFKFDFKLKNLDKLKIILEKTKPQIVINCIGITKHTQHKYIRKQISNVNSKFPFELKDLCSHFNIKLIQISTDCVFSGKKGNYNDTDKPDSINLYGISKSKSEFNNNLHLTIRTSTIGYELSSSYGLLEWFLSQQNNCLGYSNAYFSGFTMLELSNIFYDHILFNNNLTGLYNVSSQKIDKMSLLKLISKHFNKIIEIIPDYSIKIDRSLNNSKFVNDTGYKVKSWDKMIYEISKLKKY